MGMSGDLASKRQRSRPFHPSSLRQAGMKHTQGVGRWTLGLFTTCCIATSAWADQLPTKDGVAAVVGGQFSPYVGRNFPTRVLFGDTHLHTAVSVDAGTMNR